MKKNHSKPNPDTAAIKLQIQALNAAQHNPINLLPFVKIVAPIVGRVAARAAIRLAGRAAKKRFTSKQSGTIVDAAVLAVENAVKNIKI